MDENLLEVIEQVKNNNTWKYNHLKAIEELTELQMELIKKVTKRGGIKEPSDQAIIDEIGDVLIRMMILGEMYGHKEIEARVAEKLLKFKGYLEEGKYVGSI